MLEAIGPEIESHLMRVLLISGGLALVLTAAVAFVWWRGRRWANSRSSSPSSIPHRFAAFDRSTGPSGSSGAGDSPQEHDRRSGEDQLASKLVRDAAARAAALRDAWDRSYREAREPRPAEAPPPSGDPTAILGDLLREQRETNALLRELVERLRVTRDG